MKKYNPDVTFRNEEIQKSANIALLKDFLATTSVDKLVHMDLDAISRLETLLVDSIKDDLQFEKYFPQIAFVGYYQDYGQAIYRRQAKRNKNHRIKNDHIDWSDPEIVAESRHYVRHKLIPSCHTKVRDMLRGKAYDQVKADVPRETTRALKSLLQGVTAVAA